MHTPEKLVYSIDDLRFVTGLGKTKLYSLIAQGRLDARKLGSRTFVTVESARRLIDSLPAMGG